MLYGNIIFIKKTGGDGSRYPVTDKCVKIGRSEECLIRIYSNQVALEHCQLLIGENGQATLKDLSDQTVLNGNLLAKEEVTLCHGDIFKVGERLARWEYLPTSNYYRQLLSPTGRLVAVVMPQQRSLEEQSTPGTSAQYVSVLKNTSVSGKKRYSERFASDNTSVVKLRKSSGFDLIRKTKDVPKFMTGRHSLKTKKLLLSVPKIKGRKSNSSIVNSKTPKGKSRKSTLPSWREDIISSPIIKSTLGSPYSRKSTKATKSTVKNSLKDNADGKTTENLLLDANCEMNSPLKDAVTSTGIFKTSKNVPKTSLVNSLLKSNGCLRSTQSLNKTPSTKKSSLTPNPSKPVRLIHSETKLKCSLRKSLGLGKESKRQSLAVTKSDKTKRNVGRESVENFSREDIKRFGSEGVDSDMGVQGMPRSEKGFQVGTSKKIDKTAEKRSGRKAFNSYEDKVKVPRVSVTKRAWKDLGGEKLKTLGAVDVLRTSLHELDGMVNLEEERQAVCSKNNSITAKAKPRKLEKSVRKSSSICKTNSSDSPPQSGDTLNYSAKNPTSKFKSSLLKVSSKKRTSSPRGIRRKLSPSISSAERAAKKLKTSSPTKPDKNKKAALLVLGKANRKQLLTQNVKVLLKQKIVKKAIKQSSAANALSNGKGKKDSITAVKKGLQKSNLKPKLKAKKKCNSSKESADADSSKSAEESLENKFKIERTLKGENLEENSLISSKSIESAPLLRSPLKIKNLFNGGSGKSSNHLKKSESVLSTLSISSAKETTSPSGSFDMSAENFMFNSNRRCSKRLSSKNDMGRPDFIELSPTALGLIPKHIEIFKTPKQNNRRTSTFMTPKNAQSTGIIKSASTSKIGNRKSVRFSSKETSINSEICSPNPNEKTDFDFGAFQTPDMSVDVFISPLGDKSSAAKKGLKESLQVAFPPDYSELSYFKSNSEPKKCVRKLLESPQPSKRVSSRQKKVSGSSVTKSVKLQKLTHSPKENDSNRKLSNSYIEIFTTPKNNLSDFKGAFRLQRCRKNDLSDMRGVKKLLKAPKPRKSPRNDLSDVKGVKKLLATPKMQKSPKNDLSDVKGVKKLLTTPKTQKSPKNDLSDVKGVKKLLTTPKTQKSPKNDLSDVKGVKKLLTPKTQKSPKNDLSDVKGVKKLLTTPKTQKSPKNDLSDVKGVKKLLTTPKTQKSPKNDLSDVKGVKKLLTTPTTQKSPKNDLSDLRGVKRLLESPKAQKGPRNDLSDLRGVKKLLATPKTQRSQRNNLTDVTGVKELFRGPRVQKSPKNELLDLSGVQQLLGSPKLQENSKNESIDLTGVVKEGFLDFMKENLVESSKTQKVSRNSTAESKEISEGPLSGRDAACDLSNATEVKQLLTAKSSESLPKNKKTVPPKSQVSGFRTIRGSRKIYSTPKSPKNNLSDLTGVCELFSEHTSDGEFNMSLTGVAQLFEMVSTPEAKKFSQKSKEGRGKKMLESDKGAEHKGVCLTAKRRARRPLSEKDTTQDTIQETTKRSLRSRRLRTDDEIVNESTGRKPIAREKSNQPLKSPVRIKRSQRIKEAKSSGKTPQTKTKANPKETGEAKPSRKRKATTEDIASPPPKASRKRGAETSKSMTSTSKSKSKLMLKEKTSVRTPRKALTRAMDGTTSKASLKVQSKTSKTNAEQTVKVQNKRSQRNTKESLLESEGKSGPLKTRSAKGKPTPRAMRDNTRGRVLENKISKTTAGRKKLTSTVKRSTRRK